MSLTLASGVTEGAGVRTDKLNVKTGPQNSCNFGIYYFFGFQYRLLFFTGDYGFSHGHPQPESLAFLNSFSEYWLVVPI